MRVNGISFPFRCFRASKRLRSQMSGRIASGIESSIGPVVHIGLHRQEVGDLVRVGSTGSRLQHESAILWMEHRGDDAMYQRILALSVAQGSQKERHLPVRAARRNTVDDGLQLCQDLRLSERQFGIPGVIVERRDHILDLKTRSAYHHTG